MKSRQRLLSALKHEKVDRMPWTALVTDYYLQSLPPSSRTPRQSYNPEFVGADVISKQLYNPVSLLKHVGADVLELCFDSGFKEENPGLRVIKDRSGDFVNTTLVTPMGSLSQEDKQEPLAGTTFRTGFLIRNVEDCEIMEYIYEQRLYTPDYEGLKRRIDDLGDGGLVAFFGLRSPLQMLLEELAGLQTTVFLLHDYPEAIESLMRTIHKKNEEVYQILAESPVDLVFISEDTSTTMISPKMFEEYVVPCLNDYAKILHKKNKIFGVHMCGHIKGLLNLIKQLDVDGLESVTPPPTGNIELADARRVLGDKFFIMGGLDAPSVKRKTVQEVKEWVKDLLSKIPVREGLIIEVTDDVSPTTPLDNLKAIGQVIEEYG